MIFYFDMDGVLADFDSSAPKNSQALNHPSESMTDTEKQAKRQFWQTIEQNKNFWRDIPLFPGIKDVLKSAQTKGELFVLTKTPGAKHFIGGQDYVNFVTKEKIDWILKNMPEFFDEKHIIVCDGKKGALIKPTENDILVDDRAENITEWEQHNGRGILFDEISRVIKEINKL
jgi:5'(3')-deoxyribonucleotidase